MPQDIRSKVDNGSQHITDDYIFSVIPRLTYQATPRNKISAQLERMSKILGPTFKCCPRYPAVILPGQRGNDPETATQWQSGRRPYGNEVVKWTSPVTSRILLEAGYSNSFL